MGSQNVSEYDNGAFTGEISAEMLADNKIFYSIVGHSERRTLLAETNEKINIKIKQLLNHNITPILCIGENLEQRDTNTFKQIIDLQLEKLLKILKYMIKQSSLHMNLSGQLAQALYLIFLKLTRCTSLLKQK